MARQIGPPISCSVDEIVNLDELYDEIFGINRPKGVFYPIRRQDETMHFRADPDLFAQRADDLARFYSAIEDAIPKRPPQPKFQRESYVPSDPTMECKPSKKMTPQQIEAIVERLTAPRPIFTPEPILASVPQPIIDNSGTFERLYNHSMWRYGPRPPSEPNSEDEDSMSQVVEPLDRSLAGQKLIAFIHAAIGQCEELSASDLVRVLQKINVLEACEKLTLVPELARVLAKWRVREDVYSAKLVEQSLLQAIEGRRGRFRTFAKNRLSAHFANKKYGAPIPQHGESVRQAKRMTQETFDRLLTPRPDFAEVSEEESPAYEPLGFSKGTEAILRNSALAQRPQEERERELRERAATRVQMLTRDLDPEAIPKKKRRSPVTPEERTRMEERRMKRLAVEEHPYHPSLMKYDEYLKVKQVLTTEHERPKGWERAVERHRDGYRKHMEEVELAESIRALPPVKKSHRATEGKKKKPPEPPEPPPAPAPEPDPEPERGGKKKRKFTPAKAAARRGAQTVPGPAVPVRSSPFRPAS
jgi:hypothetical protein